uniref:Uncharacterized protein n=1 Tax=Psilocybe cubensis TaxID=181762 RepID=A0A8H7Y0B5_PSICU
MDDICPASPTPSTHDPCPLSHSEISMPSWSGCPSRQHRNPRRNNQTLPEPVSSLPPLPLSATRRVTLYVLDRFTSVINVFGVWRYYPRRPHHDPNSFLSLEDLASKPATFKQLSSSILDGITSYISNLQSTVHLLLQWANNGQTLKSIGQINELVDTVLLAPNFNAQDLIGFDARREHARMDKAIATLGLGAHFRETCVRIWVPSGIPHCPPLPYLVPGLLHRFFTSLITEMFTGPLAKHMHYAPFELWHQSPCTNKSERIFSELYNSDAFLAKSEAIQRRGALPPDNPNCKREKVVAALQIASDATHYTNFGNAKGWPIYVMAGNLSKYIRAQPGSGALHHLAYIPSLPDLFKDFASENHPKWKSQSQQLLTHCRRELIHGVWKIILDNDFKHAYLYGIVIKCHDGIERRFYPRIFTYSADYPEKVLLVTIRDKSLCPCPTCLVPKSKLDQLGLKRDKNLRTDNRTVRQYIVEQVALARDAIYCLGHSIKSEVVNRLLKPFSSVPTENAFVARLGLDFNPSDMLTVDLLHEFEIGVWKSLFTHLIRLLYAARGDSNELVTELDRRYRQVSTFGNGTIRNFAENSLEIKKLAAHDFEDLLQCAIPIFEGLFPDPHDRQISKLLYRTAKWHGLAKMRIHTEGSLKLLDELTFEFGKLMREFRDVTCTHFETFELPQETAARQRRQAQKQASTVENNAPAKAPSSRRSIKFNLNTPKFHFLGDYVRHIRNFGTTDSYSTQLSKVAHRLLKSLYKLTNKKDANKQIAQKYSRMMALQTERAEAAVSGHLQDTHYISKSRNTPVPIFAFMQNDTDPAKKNFLHLLKNHLLGRLTGRTFDGDDTDSLFDDEDLNTMRTYYTTYDMRRAYDTISTRSHPFVMVLSPETEPGAHPFWYASVIGVFHADVQHTGPKSRNCSPKRVEFLWVRWLGVEPGYKSGRKLACLPKIGFVVEDDEFAFGFLDPSLVVRGCHLLPSFVDGRTNELLRTTGPTQARPPQETDDWMNYYVNIFVDRDMLSQYLGIGIGHQEASGRFQFEEPSDIAEELEAAEDDGPGCPDDMSDDSESDNEDIDSHSANEDFDNDTVDNDDLGFDDL